MTDELFLYKLRAEQSRHIIDTCLIKLSEVSECIKREAAVNKQEKETYENQISVIDRYLEQDNQAKEKRT